MRHYPDFIEAYLQYSEFSEAPDSFHLWTAVSTIAGALQGKVEINQGYFRWPSNFYIVFVAPPGIVSKSTTANIGMDLLREVPEIKMGPDVVTWQALAQSFAEAAQGFQLPDSEEFEVTSSMTIASSEFGNLLNPQDRDMVNFLVHLWDGQKRTTRKLTKMSGDDIIQNPWLNIIACTTPAWIADNFSEYFIGGGFTSRCIFVYAEEKRALVPYPGQVIPEGFTTQRASLIHDLEEISQIVGDYTLTPDALAWGEVWYERNYQDHLACGGGQNQMQGYYARKQTHMHKLAMILAASESDERVITETHLERASTMLDSIEADMPKVFSQIGLTAQTRGISTMIDIVRVRGRITVTELYRDFSKQLTQSDFFEVLKSALQTGYLQMTNEGTESKVYPTPTQE